MSSVAFNLAIHTRVTGLHWDKNRTPDNPDLEGLKKLRDRNRTLQCLYGIKHE